MPAGRALGCSAASISAVSSQSLSEPLAPSPRASLSVKWSYQAKSGRNDIYILEKKAVLNVLSSNKGTVSPA